MKQKHFLEVFDKSKKSIHISVGRIEVAFLTKLFIKQLWLCLVYVKPADAPFESTLMSLHSLFNDLIIVKLFHQFLPALWSEFWSRKGTCRMIKAVIVSASIVSAWLLFNLKERHLGSSGSGFCKFLSTLFGLVQMNNVKQVRSVSVCVVSSLIQKDASRRKTWNTK